MTDFSRLLYAEGLREVRTALRVPGAILDDETLGACLSLAAFEVFECPAQCRAAYQWHRRASVNLVRMRGPRLHQFGLGHELFLAARLHGVSAIRYDYQHRRYSTLTNSEDRISCVPGSGRRYRGSSLLKTTSIALQIS